MKRTPLEKAKEKQLMAEFMYTPSDLNVQNTKIVWKTGIYIAVLLAVLFAVSYVVEKNVISWLTFLMPIGAIVIARRERVIGNHSDIQFHIGWQCLWIIGGAFALAECITGEYILGSIFVPYYLSTIISLAIMFECLRVRYASLPICASIGFILTDIREPEIDIRFALTFYFFFNLIAMIIGGLTFQWQVKNKIKNPVNFPNQA